MFISKFISFIKNRKVPHIEVRKIDNVLKILLCVNDDIRSQIICVIQTNGRILISDIVHERKEYNKGYGSQMMEELLSYASANGYKYIYGNLSEVDRGHADRLHHFYEKHGFSVTVFEKAEGMYYGKIEKRLD